MRVGIVGSSFSVGCHHNYETGIKDLALPFETWLDKHTDGMQFFNAACAGKGTELYLNKVVYLKDQHDIDILLIEIVNNRSELNFKSVPKNYKSIRSEVLMSRLEEDVYRSSESSWKYLRCLTQDMEQEIFSPNKKSFKIWKEVQWNIAATEYATEFWGMLDIYQTIKLCNMLGIRCVLWAKTWEFTRYPSFRNMLQGAKLVEFPGYRNAHNYYEDKYGLENILCDHCHFNDKVNDEMVRDFIGPALMESI